MKSIPTIKPTTRPTLYIVATPIGNLDDITLRAINTLKSVDIILAEDTRHTQKLLHHLNISDKQLLSYRDQNHNRIIDSIIAFLEMGKSLALVSDAGTPTISDPGFKLVREVKSRGFKVVPIPGVSAVITALSASGLPTDKFVFLGFLPKSKSKQQNILKTYGNLDATICIYESPFRISKLLSTILETLGDRQIAIASELTKLHENIQTDKVSNLLAQLSKNKKTRGEYTVLMSKE